MARLPELHLAVKRQDVVLVRQLLAAGADPNENAGGRRPLMLATKLCNTRILKLLLKAGADPNIAGPGDWTPLACAAYAGSHRAVALLIEAGANPRQPFFGSSIRAQLARDYPERTKILELFDEAQTRPAV